MQNLIKNYVNSTKYDLIHIVCGRLVNYTKYVDNLPVVIDWIDAFSLSTKRMYKAENMSLKKLLYYLESKKMKKFEQKHVLSSDAAYLTSHADKSYINIDDVEVIPNGVDTTVFRPLSTRKNIDLIFTGNMSYFPNIKAVEYLCEEILPLILRAYPETKLYLVGTNPDKRVSRFHDTKNVVVTGYVESITELLNRSHVFVAPLTSGTGIQNKILEAMACSIPVVTTSYGNAGISANQNEEIMIGDSPSSLANFVLDLLSSEEKRKRIGINGFKLALRKFTWESKTHLITEIYHRIVNNAKDSLNERPKVF